MARSHTHWDGGPTCSFATKKECDEAVKNFLAERKRRYDEEQARLVADKKAQQIVTFDRFIEKQRREAEERAWQSLPSPPPNSKKPTKTVSDGPRRVIHFPVARARPTDPAIPTGPRRP
jgi:hypothetical protein